MISYMDNQIDKIDRAILDHLAVDGRMPVTTLARHVGLSKTPCQLRMRRLENEGFITGYRAQISHEKLGRAHVAFVEVKLGSTTGTALAAFNRAVLRIVAVEQCHMIAGGFDYLLKVRTADITEYRRVLADEISRLPNVAQSSSYVSMQAVRESPSPPVAG